jgi:hypothetical protein
LKESAVRSPRVGASGRGTPRERMLGHRTPSPTTPQLAGCPQVGPTSHVATPDVGTLDAVPRRTYDPMLLATLAPTRVVAVETLVAAGMSSGTIAAKCRTARWVPMLRGVVAMQSGTPTRAQEVEAVLLYAGAGAVVTGHEALRRYGMRRLPDLRDVPVLVDEDRRRRSNGLATVIRTERLPEPFAKDGVPLAPFDRAATDTVRALRDRDAIRAAVAEVVGRRRSTVDRLLRELDAGDQRHSGLPREILIEATDGMRSASEGWARDLHAGSNLPPVLWNPKLYGPDGRFIAQPDAWFDDVGLAWESDSLEFHPEGDDATARRRADMVGAGILVLGHRPRRFRTEPARVIDEVWKYYALAASRPRPPIRAVPV